MNKLSFSSPWAVLLIEFHVFLGLSEQRPTAERAPRLLGTTDKIIKAGSGEKQKFLPSTGKAKSLMQREELPI